MVKWLSSERQSVFLEDDNSIDPCAHDRLLLLFSTCILERQLCWRTGVCMHVLSVSVSVSHELALLGRKNLCLCG